MQDVVNTEEAISQTADRLFLEASEADDAGNWRKAYRLYLRAAELGDRGAQINLGNYYAKGHGVRKDLAKAAHWYKLAYKAGSSTGANNLAIDKRDAGDTRGAILWFKKAIALEDGDAAVELAKLYIMRSQKNRAIEVLRLALGMKSPTCISEGGYEEAETLLQSLIP